MYDLSCSLNRPIGHVQRMRVQENFHFPKGAILTQSWAVLNSKMDKCKVSLLWYSSLTATVLEKIFKKNTFKFLRKLDLTPEVCKGCLDYFVPQNFLHFYKRKF